MLHRAHFTDTQLPTCSVPFFSRPRSEGWPHHGRTFSIYLCPLPFWLTLPRRLLSTSWCCPSRPCVAFLAFVHLALFIALSLSTGNSLVSSWCDHSMLASLLWRCLTVSSLIQLCYEPTHSLPSMKPAESEPRTERKALSNTASSKRLTLCYEWSVTVIILLLCCVTVKGRLHHGPAWCERHHFFQWVRFEEQLHTGDEMTSQSLWSRYDRHFVEDLSCYSNKIETV